MFDAAAMSRGEPGLPTRFRWRGVEYRVAGVEQAWKTSTPDRGEMYLRRHWFRVRCESGEAMTLYCERQARSRGRAKARWWVYSVASAPGRAPG